MMRLSNRIVIASTFLACFCVQSHAENLHQKFGAGWGCSQLKQGLTYKDQCLSCESKGQEFYLDSPAAGHCVAKTGAKSDSQPIAKTTAPAQPANPPANPPAQQTTAPVQDRFGAIAAATEQKKGKAKVTYGIAWSFPSRDRAQSEALSGCQKRTKEPCKIVYEAIGKGKCLYISTGTNKKGDAWFISDTGPGATESCAKKYRSCTGPVGGCN